MIVETIIRRSALSQTQWKGKKLSKLRCQPQESVKFFCAKSYVFLLQLNNFREEGLTKVQTRANPTPKKG